MWGRTPVEGGEFLAAAAVDGVSSSSSEFLEGIVVELIRDFSEISVKK